ncbi:tetratricopeptide repeat-containing sensor histidine kinase [Aquimarina brevivitae]|nr:tetratricopeptide repeat protein [Aquimarina brevivitae]
MNILLRKTILISLLCFKTLLYAQTYGEMSLKRTDKLNTQKAELLQLEKAYTYLDTSEDAKAYNISHRILKNSVYESSRIAANIVLGVYFNDKNIADSALFYGNRSLALLEPKTDTLAMLKKTEVYNIIANAYGDKSLLEKSKKWHLRGIELSKKYHDKAEYYRKLNNLASVYMRQQDFNFALQLLEECLAYDKDPEFIFSCYINLASIYSYKNDYEKSLIYLKKTLSFFRNAKELRKKVIILQNIGVQYHLLKQPDSAKQYYIRAYKLGKEKQYHRPTLDAINNLALLNKDNKNYAEATAAYEKALLMCEELGYLDKQITIYQELKNIAEIQANYKASLAYFEKEIAIKDSIQKLQRDKEIQELEVKFKTAQKEKEIEFLQIENKNKQLTVANQTEAIKNLKLQQELEKKNNEIAQKENQNKILAFQRVSEQRESQINLLKKDQQLKQASIIREKGIKNTILYSFLIIMIPIIGLLVMYYQKLQTQHKLNAQQEEINTQRIKSIIKDQELEIIKASVEGQDMERKRIAQELHDSIGGNLAAIKLQLSHFVKEEQSLQDINLQIDDTYQQVRNISHTLIPKKFRNNDFCDIIEEYLIKIGNASNLETNFQAYPRKAINQLTEQIQIEVFKIVQELLTNTIKHAQAKTVDVQLNYRDEQLNLIFEDDGIGFDPETINQGLGLLSIKNRLSSIHGTLQMDSSKGRGSLINIDINTTKSIVHEKV